MTTPKIINQRYETVSVDTLTLHPRNPRIGDLKSINDSLQTSGFFGTIIVQESTGYVLVGNHRLQAARASGMTEVPAVYVDVDDATAVRIMLADNRTAELATNDDATLAELLQELSGAGGLLGTGYEPADVKQLLANMDRADDAANEYTTKAESPIYEPTGKPPPIRELANVTERDRLLAEADDADIPDDVRAFLYLAAYRHTKFDYQTIANYYAHAPAEVQRLMESSALVIIDFNQAIERGFVRLHDSVSEAFGEDYPDA